LNRLSVGAGGMGGSGLFSPGLGGSGVSVGGTSAGSGVGVAGLVSGNHEGMSGVEEFGPPKEFEVPIA
jgi:hypothetical protein